MTFLIATLLAVATVVMAPIQASLLGAVQDSTPVSDPCPITTPEENTALVLGFIEAVYQQHDPSRIGEFFASDFNRTNLSRSHQNEVGLADDQARVERSLREFPDLSGTVDDVVASDDKVVVRMTFLGTHQGAFEDTGAEATGLEAEWSAIIIWRVECGKLIENWVVADRLAELRQLGIVTDEELASSETDGELNATPVP